MDERVKNLNNIDIGLESLIHPNEYCRMVEVIPIEDSSCKAMVEEFPPTEASRGLGGRGGDGEV